MGWMNGLRAARLRRTSPWQAALADLPAQLEPYWRASAPREYEGIPTDAFFFARAAEGLLRFFDIAARRPCALPSEAADSVWHAWLRMDPVSLERFCRHHFGTALPHVERGDMAHGTLLRTFSSSCTQEGMVPGLMRVPALFSLDADLRMPGGHGYWNRSGQICYARLNERGRGMWRGRPHPELTLAALVSVGLADPRLLALRTREQAATADGSACGMGDLAFAGSDGGSGNGDGDGGCDGGGSDSGSSCGCSCGSSCGGGGGD